MNALSKIDGKQVADCIAKFRAARPHVHCITNSVAQHFTANVLLAAGATPSMTIATEEIADFVNMADGLLINLGTMDKARTMAAHHAVEMAHEGRKCWALDPVFVQASPIRLNLAKSLLQSKPSLVRCNAAEYSALFDATIDQIDSSAGRFDTLIALTGKQDVCSNGTNTAKVENGCSTMDRITAMGCALTALMIGFLAVEEDHILASTSALVLFGLSGEVAERSSKGPGTFVPHFLDALFNLDHSEIVSGAKLK